MDFIKDNNPKYVQHVKDLFGDFPSYVKEASKTEIPAMPRGSFADSKNKEFPIDTPENTFLSYAYFKSAALDVCPRTGKSIEDSIKNAGAIQGISNDLSKIDEVLEKHATENSPKQETEYA